MFRFYYIIYNFARKLDFSLELRDNHYSNDAHMMINIHIVARITNCSFALLYVERRIGYREVDQ